jgi:outer membrane protein assembly factor BamB
MSLVVVAVVGCGAATADPQAPAATTIVQPAKPAAAKFTDPAPPKVHTLDAVAAPEPRPHPRVRFHAKPKSLAADAVTHDWRSFLGPNHNGVSIETNLLADWPAEGPPIVWELTKGTSYTSPAIQGERLVYVHRMDDEGIIECLHPETGEFYWEYRYPTQFEDRFGYNNGPRASPVIDGDRVFVYTAEGKLFCLKLETGQVYWQRDLAVEFRVPQDFFGTSTSPLVEGNLLIINVGAPGGPCVTAFDTTTGRIVWGAGERWGPSYASPVPAVVHGKRRVFVFAGGDSRPPTGGLMSIDPATGAVDFEFPWRSRVYESVNASSPVVVGNQVFVSANYFTGSALVDVKADFTHQELWTNKDLGTHWNTAIYKDGYFYGFDGHFEDDAALLCIDARTGKTVWREAPVWDETIKISGQERRVQVGICRGTLLRVDGRFLCLGEFGHLLWLDLTPDGYKELARAWLFAGRETWAPPVLSRGLVYISQNTRGMLDRGPPRLVCYDLRGE